MEKHELVEINRRVCSNMWDIAYVGKGAINGLSPKLVMPTYQRSVLIDSEVDVIVGEEPCAVNRISEQESRVFFCNVLNDTNYYYSIETPTERNYDFRNLKKTAGSTFSECAGGGISARNDLSIYRQNQAIPGRSDLQRIVNVELKAHNPDWTTIYKDIVKLSLDSAEGIIIGNWFHTLKNIDSGTIPALFEKFTRSFANLDKAIADRVVREAKLPDSISIVFCLCIIEKQWSCTKVFSWNGQQPVANYAQSFFETTDRLTPSFNTKSDLASRGWDIFEKPQPQKSESLLEKSPVVSYR